MSKSRNIADLGSNDVLDTSSTGVDVTGTVTADGLTVEENTNAKLVSADNIGEVGTGNFAFQVTESTGASLKPFGIRSESMTLATNKAALKIANNGDISFYEDTGTTPKFFWDASAERLGIGTSSPASKLHVDGAGLQIRIDGTANTSRGILLRGTGTAEGQIQTDGNMHFIQEDAGRYMRFSTANTERMRIDSSGNVGIGTSSPARLLDVAGDASINGLRVGRGAGDVSSNTAAGSGALNANTTGYNNTAVGRSALENCTTGAGNTALGKGAGVSMTTAVNNTFIGTEAGEDVTTGRDNTFVGNLSGYNVTTGSDNTIIGRFSGNAGGVDIRTSNNNIVLSDGAGNPRMHIDSSGYIAGADNIMTVRTTATNNSNRGMILFRDGSGDFCGQITSNPSTNTTAYNTSSDYRLKQNVVDLTGAIDRLNNLNVKRFTFISDPDDTVVDGFLAHEAQTVVPEAVTGEHDEVDDDGNPVYQGIDQSKLVPLLTAALQEAIAKIDALETTVTDLTSRIDTLEGN